jgi:hypothetical protein
MNHAFMMMRAKTNDQKRYFNSRLYEYKRKDFSKALSFSQSGCKNSMFGKTRSEEEKAKISKSLKKRRTSSTKRDLKKQRGEELRKAQKARALEL